jgi:hypothetical protein
MCYCYARKKRREELVLEVKTGEMEGIGLVGWLPTIITP